MSNENEQNIMPQKKPNQKRCPWHSFKVIILPVILLIIIASGIAGYCCLKKLSLDQQRMTQELTAAQQTTTELQQKVLTLVSSQEESAATIKTLQENVAAEQNTKQNWQSAEAYYDVKLANANLQYADNIPTAIILLTLADNILKNLNDPLWDPARQALANDLGRLRQVQPVDVTGLYMRLTAVNQQIDQLTLPTQLNAQAEEAKENKETNLSWWQRGLHNTWQGLQKIVVVHYYEKGTLPLVTPEQQQFLFQNLHAKLAEAIWALLHGQTTIYQASLQQASDWIKKYFTTNTDPILNELAELQKTNIHAEPVNINETIATFEKINNQVR